jgi:hypothetical protein
MTNRLVLAVAVGSTLFAFGCAAQNAEEEEAIEVATSAAGLACIAWSQVQSGSVTIGANGIAAVVDGDFFNPFYVGDGYAFKLKHDSVATCQPQTVKIYGHTSPGSPETELTPLRYVAMPDGSRIWAYKPNVASSLFNLATKIKGTPGSVCTYMTMTCVTE